MQSVHWIFPRPAAISTTSPTLTTTASMHPQRGHLRSGKNSNEASTATTDAALMLRWAWLRSSEQLLHHMRLPAGRSYHCVCHDIGRLVQRHSGTTQQYGRH